MRFALLSAFFLCAACASPRFSPVDPADRDREECFTGAVLRLDVAHDGTFALEIAPNAADWSRLAPGQRTVICEMMQADRARDFSGVLSLLRVGSRVEVCGYWVLDAERPGQHIIRTVTSVDPFVD